MTDLVQRLRMNIPYESPLHLEAANRIEALEAALKYMAETKLIDDDYQEIARAALEEKVK